MPVSIQWGTAKKIDIQYDAAGSQLSRTVYTGVTVDYKQDYVAGVEYRTVGGTRKLESIAHVEGRRYNVNVNTGTSAESFRIEYSIRDHLGNTRLTFTDKNSDGKIDVTTTAANEILSEQHYYAFGLSYGGNLWMNDGVDVDNRYLYNGKELMGDHGLWWYNYGARWYDPALGRFSSIDPLTDTFPTWSPYNYVLGNPIKLIDRDGKKPEDIIILKGLENSGNSGKGHAAVLIGDDENGWTYVSKDGPSSGGLIFSLFSSGGVTNEVKDFATLDDFIKGSVSDMPVSEAYSLGVRFETTEEEDQTALSAAKASANENFNFVSKNCTSVCRDALDEVGVDHGNIKTPEKLINYLWKNPDSKPVIIR